ncbi:MAG: hypothetical protein V7608_2984, partial [Hyphomicrobiales bacterium]
MTKFRFRIACLIAFAALLFAPAVRAQNA